MAADSIGYPLPVIKNGYACLNASEIELARKNIDPARPKAEPESRKPDAGNMQPAAERIAAARQDAAVETGRVIGYSPEAVRRGTAATGTVMSLSA